jgi:hydroxypyruvate reductase
MYADLLNQAYKAAIAAADPLQCLGPQHLPARPKGRTLVVGAGKAAASMALAVERHWPENAPLEGLVITRYAHGLPLTRLQCMEAGHPVPDEAGQRAAQTIAQRVTELTPDDQLLVLVSGGGSSLLTLPAPGLSMDDLRAVTQQLLRSGAPIQDMNIVRRHLSRLQGGQLALMSKAPVQTLVISDVVGDQACDIASGPCDPDPSSFEDARAVLARWNVEPPRAVAERLESGCKGAIAETPKPGDPRLAHATTLMLATAKASLDEACRILVENGFQTLCLGDGVTGEARDVAGVMASLVREITNNRIPEFRRPVAIVSGGECTVTVRGSGEGGRCSEFLLAHGLALEALGVGPCVWGLAADSDGIDGSSDAAGAYFDPGFLNRARAQGLDPRGCLDNNDALSLFRALGTDLCTGPTRTNINDIRLLLVVA